MYIHIFGQSKPLWPPHRRTGTGSYGRIGGAWGSGKSMVWTVIAVRFIGAVILRSGETSSFEAGLAGTLWRHRLSTGTRNHVVSGDAWPIHNRLIDLNLVSICLWLSQSYVYIYIFDRFKFNANYLEYINFFYIYQLNAHGKKCNFIGGPI